MNQTQCTLKQYPALLELDTLHLVRFPGTGPRIYIKTNNYWYKYHYLSESFAKMILHQLLEGSRRLDVVLYNTDTQEGSSKL